MRVIRILGLFLYLMIFGISLQAQERIFEVSQLSENGKKAFETLSSVSLFALGGTGYGGEISSGELALRELVREKQAMSALRQLVSTATPEGGLYALLGLKLLKCDCLKTEYATFISLPEPEARSGKGRLPTAKGHVSRMAGCIGFQEERPKVAKEILDGNEEIDWVVKYWPAVIRGN